MIRSPKTPEPLLVGLVARGRSAERRVSIVICRTGCQLTHGSYGCLDAFAVSAGTIRSYRGIGMCLPVRIVFLHLTVTRRDVLITREGAYGQGCAAVNVYHSLTRPRRFGDCDAARLSCGL